jgi:hypothetical protein
MTLSKNIKAELLFWIPAISLLGLAWVVGYFLGAIGFFCVAAFIPVWGLFAASLEHKIL